MEAISVNERYMTFPRRLTLWGAASLLSACASNAQMSSLPNGTTSPPQASLPLAKNATYYGCPEFTDNTYTGNIKNSPVDPNSAAYINSVIQAGDTGGFFASTGVEKINLANGATPLRVVHPLVKWHQFPKKYPWATNFYIEPLSDAHAMVVQTNTCHLFESYDTQFKDPTLSAYSGANWSLNSNFVPLSPGTSSAMASGLPLFAGMVRWEDYQSGSIDHALSWDAQAGTVAAYQFVRPASDTDHLPFKGQSSYQMPYGAHLRLKASFSTQGWGSQATMVANAMKTHGVYLADTDSSGNALYFANAADGSVPWDTHDLSSLSSITMGDFDVLKLGQILKVPGH